MSVINKMLRDLDQRQAPGTIASDPLRRSTQSVAPVSEQPRSPIRPWLLGLGFIALAGMAAWSWWEGQEALPVAVAPAMPAPLQVPAPQVSASAPLVEAQAPAVAASAVEAAMAPPVAVESQPAVAEIPDATKTVKAPIAPPATVPEPKAQQVPPPAAPTSVGLRMDQRIASAPPAKPESTSPKSESGAGSSTAAGKTASPLSEAGTGSRQQLAGREALSQAQSLWASGARDVAMTTLQEAIASVERNPQTASVATLVPMARELARMQLAEGQPAAAWELLVRLEPFMTNQPDLWALRANAAQRLAKHQDSVQSYTTALSVRPGEQRWMLGAAVSMAALGQTTAAADMAEKARTLGPVSRDVLAYLRQQGVPLTDRP